MMRPIVVNVETASAADFVTAPAINTATSGVDITWLDWTPVTPLDYANNTNFGQIQNEIGFNIWRSRSGGALTKVGAALANKTTFNDPTGVKLTDSYVVEAYNASGSTFSSTPGDVTLTVTGGPTAPANLYLNATIDPPLGLSVTSVTYYNGANIIGTSTNPFDNFLVTWAGVPAGTHIVKAVATATLLDAASKPVTLTKASLTQSVVLTNTMTVTATANNNEPINVCDSITLDSTVSGTFNPPLTYAWNVDGVLFNTADVILPVPVGGHIGGAHSATLTVTDSSVPPQVQKITVNPFTVFNTPPTANAKVTDPLVPYAINFGGTLTLDAAGADTANLCNTLSYAWDIDSNGTYDYFTKNRTLKYTVLQPWLGAGEHTITLRVADSSGESTIATALLNVGPPPNADAPATITVPANSSTGTYTVSWAPAAIAGATYTLEESTDNFATSTVVASGLTTTSKLITGKTGGLYYYRVQTVALATVTSPWTTGNNPCAILLTTVTSPAAGSTFNPGQLTSIVGSATTPTGYAVASMAFFDNGVLIGTDSDGAPYTVAFNPTAVGTHTLTATTTYVGGATSPSSTVAITIAGVTAPALTTSSAVYDLGDTITLNVTPAAVVGVVPTPTVSVVTYYENGTPIGFDDTAPYSIAWVPTGGAKSVTVVALYSNGMSATSAVLPLTVNTQVIAPASITVPATSATGNYQVSWEASLTSGVTYVLEESTTATFDLGAVTPVTVTPPPATSVAISGKPTGTYYYRVKAVKLPMVESGWVVGGNGCVVTINVASQANGGVATASSTSGGWSLPAVNNADRNATGGADGAWVDATPGTFPDWVQIAFSGQKTIDEIDVYTLKDNFSDLGPIGPAETFANYGITSFDVQYLSGASWVTVPGGNIAGNNLVWTRLTFPPVVTDQIRVLINGTADGYSRIVEIEAYATNAAVAPTPVVTMTAPADGTVYPVAPTTIDLAADVSVVAGWNTDLVEFYNGATLLGSANAAPFTFSWLNAPAGSHVLTAKAYDNTLVATVTSAPVGVAVGIPPVNVASQANGGVATASSTSGGWSLPAVNNADRNATGGADGAWADATPGTFPDWVQIAFSGQKTIDEIDVYALKDNFSDLGPIGPAETFANYGITSFDVQYLSGASWVTVPGGNIAGNNLVWTRLTFPPVVTDQIRVLINGTADGYSRIVEIEAWTP